MPDQDQTVGFSPRNPLPKRGKIFTKYQIMTKCQKRFRKTVFVHLKNIILFEHHE